MFIYVKEDSFRILQTKWWTYVTRASMGPWAIFQSWSDVSFLKIDMKILESLLDKLFHISDERNALGRVAFNPILDGVWYNCLTLQTLKSMLVHECHFRKFVTVGHFRLISFWRLPLPLCVTICVPDDILLDLEKTGN